MTSTSPEIRNGHVSFWLDQLGRNTPTRPHLERSADVDVCIVGGGFTGLWTAYYLKQEKPELRIALLEQEFCGYGASGRNGGWLTAALSGSRERYAATHGRDGVIALQDAMVGAVHEVMRVAEQEAIDADIVHAGVMSVACSPAQRERLIAEVAEHEEWGDESHQLLTAEETRDRIAVADAVAGAWTPHCARIHPGKLVTALSDVVERLGVEIYESTPALVIESGRVTTPYGVVRAGQIVRATEGFTARLPGLRRTWLPMNSAIVVTEPLPDAVWDEIGWNGYETLGDAAHAYLYAQRTADGRIALGGRGVPYRYASRTDDHGVTQQATITELRELLHRRFPQVRDARIDHVWAGVLGVPRDWCSTVRLDPETQIAAAGGYVGHGVATTNLAGRTLRDLLLGRNTELTELPWVGRRARKWEPEPLRWLGVQAMYKAYHAADRIEDRGGRTSWIAHVADRITGH